MTIDDGSAPTLTSSTVAVTGEEVCDNCKNRPGTVRWVGNGGMLAVTHGWIKMWCEICVLEKQIEYGEEIEKELEGKRQEYAKLINEENQATAKRVKEWFKAPSRVKIHDEDMEE